MATVEQIWREVLPSGTKLQAGEAGIFNEVSWAVTVRPYPPGLDALKGNEFILIELALVAGLGISLSGLVTLLTRQAASGIAVLGKPSSDALETAESGKMPVFRLPPLTNLGDLQNKIAGSVSSERLILYRTEQELSRKLMEVALAERGISAILNRLEEISGRRCLLVGSAFGFIFPPEIPAGGVERITRLLATKPSGVMGLKITDELACFVGPVLGRHGMEGYLIVLAPSGQLTEKDRLAVKVGSLALAVETSRRHAMEAAEEKFQSEMIEALLSGSLSPSAVAERAERLGLDVSSQYTAAAGRITGSRLGQDQIVKDAISLFGDICLFRGDVLLALHSIAASATSQDLRGWGKELARQLATRVDGTITLGMGRAYSGLDGLRLSVREAEEALMIGEQLFGSGSASFFGDLGIYRLLFGAKREELRAYHQEYLGRLSEYDKKHGGVLMETLQALLQNSTLTQAAAALHVHRNTLLYRIQRIQEIANLDLEDGETRLALHLAVRAGDIIGRLT